MAFLMIAWVFALGMLVCWIMTLVKIFQDKEKNGVLHGVLGLLCSLWAFIWGWMNTARYGNKKVMLIWTVCLVLWGICYGIGTAALVAEIANQQPR